jgi:hypothetical protein
VVELYSAACDIALYRLAPGSASISARHAENDTPQFEVVDLAQDRLTTRHCFVTGATPEYTLTRKRRDGRSVIDARYVRLDCAPSACDACYANSHHE